MPVFFDLQKSKNRMSRYSFDHRLIAKFFLICSITLAGSTAWATNLEDVYVASKGHDPVLGAARADYASTQQIVPQARSQLLPNVAVGAQTNWNEREFVNSGLEQEFNDNSWQAQLRQPIVNLERWYTYTSSKASVESARLGFSATEQNLIVRAIDAYLDVLRADALVEATRAAEDAVERQLEQVQQRFDVGLVAITDVLEAQAEFDNSVVNRVQAVGDHDIFFEVLRTLAGRPYDEIDFLSESLPVIDPEPSNEEEWVRVALQTNFNVLAAESALAASNRTVRARRSGHLPTVDATITESSFTTGGQNFLGSEIDNTVYGLSVTLPIYQGGFTSSRTKEAQFLAERSRQLLADSRLTVSRDIRNLFRRVTTDVVRVRARLKGIASSESALEATQTGYDVGTRNIVDVLDAQNRLFSSQFDYADSRYNYVRSLILLKQRAGTLNEADLLDLNTYTDPAVPVKRLASLKLRSD